MSHVAKRSKKARNLNVEIIGGHDPVKTVLLE